MGWSWLHWIVQSDSPLSGMLVESVERASGSVAELLQRRTLVRGIGITRGTPGPQFLPQPNQYPHLVLNRCQLLRRQGAARSTGRAAAQSKERPDLVQGKSALLRMFDEAQTRALGEPGAAGAVLWA